MTESSPNGPTADDELSVDDSEEEALAEDSALESDPAQRVASIDEIWMTIGTLRAAAKPAEAPVAQAKDPDEVAAKRRKRRRLVRFLDLVAFVLWAYSFVKLFVGDLDRIIVASVSPALLWLLDFRFFGALAAVALLLVVFRLRKVGLPLLYVAFWPLVVVFWKLPKAIVVRLRRPSVALGILNVLTNAVFGVKWTVIGFAWGSICALFIVVSRTPWLVAVGIVGLAILLVVWLSLSVRNSVRPSRFISGQQKIISLIVDLKIFDGFKGERSPVDEETLRAWDAAKANQYVMDAGTGLLIYRTAYYWAFSLDQYRRGSARVIFSGFAVAALFVQVAVIFGFLNYGLFQIDASQYSFHREPSYWTFLYYSFAGSLFGEISALAPIGSWAIAVKIANGLLGSVLVLTLVASIFLNYRQGRTDEASSQAIEQLRSKAQDVGGEVGSNFALSVDDLERRLAALQWGALGVVNWLTSRVPGDWNPGGRT